MSDDDEAWKVKAREMFSIRAAKKRKPVKARPGCVIGRSGSKPLQRRGRTLQGDLTLLELQRVFGPQPPRKLT